MASYLEMDGANATAMDPSLSYLDRRTSGILTPQEAVTLKGLLARLAAQDGDDTELINNINLSSLSTDSFAGSTNSDYPEFTQSTHAWAVFADNPQTRAGWRERAIGILIILFQLFTYYVFAAEAIEDYQAGSVPVLTRHADCYNSDEQPQANFTCEAEFTNASDAFIAFFMLGVFLTGEFLQAVRVIRAAPFGNPLIFACLAGLEVISAYIAACISISYHLYIGEVTDAIEVGVGLLFIRELSQRTYAGIRYGKQKQYTVFFGVLVILVAIGMLMDPLCELLFAVTDNGR